MTESNVTPIRGSNKNSVMSNQWQPSSYSRRNRNANTEARHKTIKMINQISQLSLNASLPNIRNNSNERDENPLKGKSNSIDPSASPFLNSAMLESLQNNNDSSENRFKVGVTEFKEKRKQNDYYHHLKKVATKSKLEHPHLNKVNSMTTLNTPCGASCSYNTAGQLPDINNKNLDFNQVTHLLSKHNTIVKKSIWADIQ